MRRAIILVIGMLLGAAGNGLFAQTKPAPAAKPAAKPATTTPAAKPAAKPATAAPAAKQTAKPATTTPAAKPAAKPATAAPAAKTAAKPVAKPAVKAPKSSAKKAAAPATGAAPAPAEEKVARRDPFESLVGRDKANAEANKNLPPGKAGLQVSSLRLDGIVRAPNGMIAVVTNPQSRTYFLREGDQLYDGRVEKIAMDGVSFHEIGKDAFGKPVERQVNKRIYSSAGEQQ
jgi:outer membrane biosynthesis protein TonB